MHVCVPFVSAIHNMEDINGKIVTSTGDEFEGSEPLSEQEPLTE